MSLYEIAENIEAVINGAFVVDEETGEILFDESNLEEIESSFNDKLENCGLFVKNLKSESEAIDKEIRALQARKKSKDNKAARLSDYILKCMDLANTSKLETARVSVALRSSQYLEIIDESQIPEDYKEIVETVKLSKLELKKAIKAGEEISGCELRSRSNLVIK